eukprot:7582425-Pyramimonas_sp.AAC.1
MLKRQQQVHREGCTWSARGVGGQQAARERWGMEVRREAKGRRSEGEQTRHDEGITTFDALQSALLTGSRKFSGTPSYSCAARCAAFLASSSGWPT